MIYIAQNSKYVQYGFYLNVAIDKCLELRF